MRFRRTPRPFVCGAVRHRRLALSVGRRAGECANHLALGIEELDRDQLRGLFQVVVDRDGAIEPAQRIVRLVEVLVRRDLETALTQRRDVVHDVEPAAVRRDDEIAVLDGDVVDRRVRQVLPQRLPFRAVVERNVDAVLGAQIQQLRLLDVLANRAREVGRADAVGDRRPGLAVIVGPEDVRLEVVLLIAIRGDISGAGAERRRLNQADAREVAERLRRHVLPVGAAVARHLHVAVVGAGPDDAAVLRGRRDREHRRVGFDAGVVLRDGAAGGAHRLRIVAREVRADLFPALSLVGRFPDVLRADVDDPRVGRRHDDRKRPLEPLGDVGGRIAHRIVRVGIDLPLLAGALVLPGDQAAVAAGVEDVRVARVARDVPALAATHRVEHLVRAAAGSARSALGRDAGHARGAVVLLGAADVIRDVLGRDHVVELRRRHQLLRPRLAAVDRDGAAAVVGLDHPVRIGRCDPHVVVVAVRHVAGLPRLARVRRLVDVDVQHPDGVLHLGIGIHPRVVERPLTEIAALVHLLPVRPRVVRHEEAAVLRLDLGIQARRVRAGDREPDLAEHALRQTGIARDFGPVIAAVSRLEDAAARAAARHFERVA